MPKNLGKGTLHCNNTSLRCWAIWEKSKQSGEPEDPFNQLRRWAVLMRALTFSRLAVIFHMTAACLAFQGVFHLSKEKKGSRVHLIYLKQKTLKQFGTLLGLFSPTGGVYFKA